MKKQMKCVNGHVISKKQISKTFVEFIEAIKVSGLSCIKEGSICDTPTEQVVLALGIIQSVYIDGGQHASKKH